MNNETKKPTDIAMGSSALAMRDQPKEGGLCLGCCCDYRRAVVILSVLGIVFSVLQLVLGLGSSSATVSDDEVQANLDDAIESYDLIQLILQIGGIVMNLVNLYGAVRFVWVACAAYVGWAFIQFGVGIIANVLAAKAWLEVWNEKHVGGGDDIFSSAFDSIEEAVEQAFRKNLTIRYIIYAVLLVIWIYPTIMLTMEMKKGVMTQETYPREAASCCCTASKKNATPTVAKASKKHPPMSSPVVVARPDEKNSQTSQDEGYGSA